MTRTTLALDLPEWLWAPVGCPIPDVRAYTHAFTGLRVAESVRPERVGGRLWHHVRCAYPGGRALPTLADLHLAHEMFIGRERQALYVLPAIETRSSRQSSNPAVLHLWCCLAEDAIGTPAAFRALHAERGKGHWA